MNEADIRTVDHAQPGWRIANDCVELFVTEKGGHMAPGRKFTDLTRVEVLWKDAPPADCTCFGDGIGASSRPNPISDAGYPTAVDLSPHQPTDVRLIQGAARITPAFQQLQSVSFEEDRVTFTATTGESVSTGVCWRFLYE